VTFLKPIRLTDNAASGAGCLFAQIVKHFNEGVGNVYIEDPHSDVLEEYNYYVDVDDDTLTLELQINEDDSLLFRGPVAGAYNYIQNPPQLPEE